MMGTGSCPRCGGDIEGSNFDADGALVWQRCSCLDPECGESWIDTYSISSVQEYGSDDRHMATAAELRHSLSDLLDIFDAMYAEGEDWESDPRIILARQTLAKGFPETVEEAES